MSENSETPEISAVVTTPKGKTVNHAKPLRNTSSGWRTNAMDVIKGAALPATLVTTWLVGGAIENGSKFRPSANEYYTGNAIIELDSSVARPSAGKFENEEIDEHELTVNGQSLQGVKKIKVSNPELAEIQTLNEETDRIETQLIIKVPFDNGVEVYYVYGGPNGIKFKGGEIIKGQEREDGSFQTESGNTIPADEMGQVTVVSNKPQE